MYKKIEKGIKIEFPNKAVVVIESEDASVTAKVTVRDTTGRLVEQVGKHGLKELYNLEAKYISEVLEYANGLTVKQTKKVEPVKNDEEKKDREGIARAMEAERIATAEEIGLEEAKVAEELAGED